MSGVLNLSPAGQQLQQDSWSVLKSRGVLEVQGPDCVTFLQGNVYAYAYACACAYADAYACACAYAQPMHSAMHRGIGIGTGIAIGIAIAISSFAWSVF